MVPHPGRTAHWATLSWGLILLPHFPPGPGTCCLGAPGGGLLNLCDTRLRTCLSFGPRASSIWPVDWLPLSRQHFHVRDPVLIQPFDPDLVLVFFQHNSAIATGGGGLASAFKPRLRLRQGLPLMLETVPVVGGSPGVNMTPR